MTEVFSRKEVMTSCCSIMYNVIDNRLYYIQRTNPNLYNLSVDPSLFLLNISPNYEALTLQIEDISRV